MEKVLTRQLLCESVTFNKSFCWSMRKLFKNNSKDLSSKALYLGIIDALVQKVHSKLQNLIF